jgi:hypothetical protein
VSILSASQGVDARQANRASIFLVAALYCDGSSLPVKIRNISATGALVDCAVVPSAGSLVQLVRGRLIAHALVAWAKDGRCGLKFSGSIDVQQWRAAPANVEQQRIDEVVRLVKAGVAPLSVAPLAPLSERNDMPGSAAQLSAELRRISGLLEEVGEALANDPEVVTRHGPILQNVDIAMQVITAVEAIIIDHGDFEGGGAKRMALRRRADHPFGRSA